MSEASNKELDDLLAGESTETAAKEPDAKSADAAKGGLTQKQQELSDLLADDKRLREEIKQLTGEPRRLKLLELDKVVKDINAHQPAPAPAVLPTPPAEDPEAARRQAEEEARDQRIKDNVDEIKRLEADIADLKKGDQRLAEQQKSIQEGIDAAQQRLTGAQQSVTDAQKSVTDAQQRLTDAQRQQQEDRELMISLREHIAALEGKTAPPAAPAPEPPKPEPPKNDQRPVPDSSTPPTSENAPSLSDDAEGVPLDPKVAVDLLEPPDDDTAEDDNRKRALNAVIANQLGVPHAQVGLTSGIDRVSDASRSYQWMRSCVVKGVRLHIRSDRTIANEDGETQPFTPEGFQELLKKQKV